MMKPYAVEVILSGKRSEKDFLTKQEMAAYLKKAEALKTQAPSLLVNIIREPNRIKPRVDEEKENCLAWVRLESIGANGLHNYQCVAVPKKPGMMYCPHCHGYKKMAKLDYDNGLIVDGCPGCEMSSQDFYIKTANNLWTKG